MNQNNYLSHFGIKGQKWGVRRFQNEDGSLTPAGRERYYQLVSTGPRFSDYVEDQKKTAGVEKRTDADYITKGSTFQRIADFGELVDGRRKYVSLTREDNDRYNEMSEMLGVNDPYSAKLYKYKVNRDLKVASKKDVSDYLISKYGDDKIRDLINRVDELSVSEKLDWTKLSKEDREIVRTVNDEYDRAKSEAFRFFKNTLFNNKKINDDVIQAFSERGYDAIVDVQDSYIADYPLILLNPTDKDISVTSITNLH